MSDQFKPENKVVREIEKEWDRFIKVAQKIDFGRLEVILQNGKPVRIEIAVKQIKLDVDKDYEDGLKTIPLL